MRRVIQVGKAFDTNKKSETSLTSNTIDGKRCDKFVTSERSKISQKSETSKTSKTSKTRKTSKTTDSSKLGK